MIPAQKTMGRPREVNIWRVPDTLLYMARADCAWRLLPREHFPPWETVYGYFRQWSEDGIWQRIHDTLRAQVRSSEKAGRHKHPTAEQPARFTASPRSTANPIFRRQQHRPYSRYATRRSSHERTSELALEISVIRILWLILAYVTGNAFFACVTLIAPRSTASTTAEPDSPLCSWRARMTTSASGPR